jgi:adenylosuccinate lyase
MRLLYSSAIGEVSSLDAAARLKGSSADAGKNNPINWENIAGKAKMAAATTTVTYLSIESDLQRDLRNSVLGRYQPQLLLSEFYESVKRATRSLRDLTVIEPRMAENLNALRNSPTEAMTAILRAHGYVHPSGKLPHDLVAESAKEAKATKTKLLDVALQDKPFAELFQTLSDRQRQILQGEIELYTGFHKERMLRRLAEIKMRLNA